MIHFATRAFRYLARRAPFRRGSVVVWGRVIMTFSAKRYRLLLYATRHLRRDARAPSTSMRPVWHHRCVCPILRTWEDCDSGESHPIKRRAWKLNVRRCCAARPFASRYRLIVPASAHYRTTVKEMFGAPVNSAERAITPLTR